MSYFVDVSRAALSLFSFEIGHLRGYNCLILLPYSIKTKLANQSNMLQRRRTTCKMCVASSIFILSLIHVDKTITTFVKAVVVAVVILRCSFLVLFSQQSTHTHAHSLIYIYVFYFLNK